MCVSAIVETELERLATRLGLGSLAPAAGGGGEALPRRIEAHAAAWVVRAAGAGRLAAEPMAFKPYVLRRQNLGGDMWASSLLAANHGVVVIRSLSEWVSVDLLLSHGLISIHDANCAFNRVTGGRLGRLLLVNFTPATPLIVPVLFDHRQPQDPARPGPTREFVIVSDESSEALHGLGLTQSPVNLSPDAALEWLQTEGVLPEGALGDGAVAADDEAVPFAIDFEEVLEDGKAAAFAFSLFKSA